MQHTVCLQHQNLTQHTVSLQPHYLTRHCLAAPLPNVAHCEFAAWDLTQHPVALEDR